MLAGRLGFQWKGQPEERNRSRTGLGWLGSAGLDWNRAPEVAATDERLIRPGLLSAELTAKLYELGEALEFSELWIPLGFLG